MVFSVVYFSSVMNGLIPSGFLTTRIVPMNFTSCAKPPGGLRGFEYLNMIPRFSVKFTYYVDEVMVQGGGFRAGVETCPHSHLAWIIKQTALLAPVFYDSNAWGDTGAMFNFNSQSFTRYTT